MNTLNTTKLTKHIISTVYEGLIKLGTTGNENYSIFYDLELLNYLLDTNYTEKEECLKDLLNVYQCGNESPSSEPLQIHVALEKGRFRFTVLAVSIPYVRSEGESNGFLRDIIELVKTQHFHIEDVKNVFNRYSTDYTCESVDHPEFQYVLYFNHEDINQYKYCFSFDGCCGGYYHRLLSYDYDKLKEK